MGFVGPASGRCMLVSFSIEAQLLRASTKPGIQQVSRYL